MLETAACALLLSAVAASHLPRGAVAGHLLPGPVGRAPRLASGHLVPDPAGRAHRLAAGHLVPGLAGRAHRLAAGHLVPAGCAPAGPHLGAGMAKGGAEPREATIP